jgi:hypothetical protein
VLIFIVVFFVGTPRGFSSKLDIIVPINMLRIICVMRTRTARICDTRARSTTVPCLNCSMRNVRSDKKIPLFFAVESCTIVEYLANYRVDS